MCLVEDKDSHGATVCTMMAVMVLQEWGSPRWLSGVKNTGNGDNGRFRGDRLLLSPKEASLKGGVMECSATPASGAGPSFPLTAARRVVNDSAAESVQLS
ncbi:hypothetical protein JZ751_001351 [Albula glossodonta]|uniref:Uncharacterized protein n=1 Tax=Albula glossodonta TaxID=121402 RepID=A0A8T2PTQ1_9TELE|nr:hypothetical protein JZ751_001351 [Albula glossodonta]